MPCVPAPQRGIKHRHLQRKKIKMNTGKKIVLLFVGIAAILQIGVVGFLVFKRRQLWRILGLK
ncbi:hypothetical protein JCGZ_01825 [Jatropha curcas]|uniref:Uncharacterized protein n=1 Tax=Jatropha curcas TaxID=180498 RepID=A0A067JIW3_JATCU|nr:hypothetical protein JCGZ_01825 [Jatropha curcas]